MIEISGVQNAHISCRNSRGKILYVEETLGKDHVAELFTGILDPETLISDNYCYLGKPLDLAFFMEANNWYNNEINLQIFANMKAMNLDPFDTGYYSVKSAAKMNNLAILALLHTIGPMSVVRRIATINAVYNRTKSIKVLDYSPGYARVETKYGKDFTHNEMVSKQNLGCYYAGLELIGGEDITAEMEVDEYCPGGTAIMRFTWRPVSFFKRLRWSLSYMVVRLFGGSYIRSAHAIRTYHGDLQRSLDAELSEKEAQRQKSEDYYKALIQAQQAKEDELNRLVAQKTKALQQSLEEKEQLFENFSHELKTPLTLVLGPLEQVLKQSLPAELHHTLSGVQHNAERLFELVQQLLSLAEAKVYFDKKEAVHLQERVEYIAHSLNALAQERGCTWRFSYSFDAALVLSLQAQTFAIVLSNLLVNALKHGAEHTDASKPEKYIELSCDYDDGTLCISVRDQNPKIPEQVQQTIFQRFRRNSSAEGQGLGLALVKELVEKQGGHIELNASDSGNCFTFSIPADIADSAELSAESAAQVDTHIAQGAVQGLAQKVAKGAAGPSPEPSQGANGAKVLLVEDNLEHSEFLIQIFSSHYHVQHALNGKEAIAALEHFDADLVVSDVMMPEMDGFELCAAIKQSDAYCHLPVILLTAKSDLNSQKQGLMLKADDYIGKPFNSDVLLHKVDNILATRRHFAARLRQQVLRSVPHKQSASPASSQDNASEQLVDKSKALIDKIEHFMAQNFHRPELKSADFANAVHMSERTLNRKLKAMLGQSAKELLRDYRITQAKALLAQGKLQKQVCYDCGFSSEAYFSRVLKEADNSFEELSE